MTYQFVPTFYTDFIGQDFNAVLKIYKRILSNHIHSPAVQCVTCIYFRAEKLKGSGTVSKGNV